MPAYALFNAGEITARAVNTGLSFWKTAWEMVPNGGFVKPIALAWIEAADRITRAYPKQGWMELFDTIEGGTPNITPTVLKDDPFCELMHFRREGPEPKIPRKKILVVAPMSGHHANLLYDTVHTLLTTKNPDGSENDVFITDWKDAKNVPLSAGDFGHEEYIDTVFRYNRFIAVGDGRNTNYDLADGRPAHIIAVCQPGPLVMAGLAYHEKHADENTVLPASVTLMGSPIDARVNPTEVCKFATSRPLAFFDMFMRSTVPFGNAGFGRDVYAGFKQRLGFMSMNMFNHWRAYTRHFFNMVQGDGEGQKKHRVFYNVYNSVMDMTYKFYRQTIDSIFQRFLLPKGEFEYRGEKVNLKDIVRTPVMCVEGEKDDITGLGQCFAAIKLAVNLARDKTKELLAPKVGHYGIFSGKTWRTLICPAVLEFTSRFEGRKYTPHQGLRPVGFEA